MIAAVIGGGWLALTLFTTWAEDRIRDRQVTGKDAVAIELDAVKTALTVAAGLGAGITLLLALRRQSTAERAQQFTELDAQEQRITDLYVAAANQLGSDKAAVRLAGLYALQRLGQNNRHLRQTVFDVICAYLRMPYTPPLEVPEEEGTESAAFTDDHFKEQAERRQELQVRLAAQRLLADHTRIASSSPSQRRHEPETYWRTATGERMDIDLTQAGLVDFDLGSCHVRNFQCVGAVFHGQTSMSETSFYRYINFSKAQFGGSANLIGAQFHGYALLSQVQFHGDAKLSGVNFHFIADLSEAQFHGNLILKHAQFADFAEITKVHVRASADFSAARFSRDVDLSETRFHGPVNLSRATFSSFTNLSNTRFDQGVDLTKADFRPDVTLVGALFTYDSVLPDG